MWHACLQRHLVIALFLTMLTGTAGNAGNQSSAMVIRGLATGEINRKNAWKVIVRELKVSAGGGVVMNRSRSCIAHVHSPRADRP